MFLEGLWHALKVVSAGLYWLLFICLIWAGFALMGTATFSLYTCALTMLGEHFRGGMLVAGAAAYALAYAIGSGAGSSATGAIMEWGGPHAGPLAVGAALTVFTAFFALSGRRRG